MAFAIAADTILLRTAANSTKPPPRKLHVMADLQELSRCLVKYFNISGSEFVAGSTCIKSTGSTRCIVSRGEVVSDTTPGVGIAVA